MSLFAETIPYADHTMLPTDLLNGKAIINTSEATNRNAMVITKSYQV